MWNLLRRFRDPAKPSLTPSGPRGEFVREFTADGYVVQMEESQQTLKLHAEDDLDWPRPALHPTIASLRKRSYSKKFVSGSMLAHKAKQFDDGLYAAVDLAGQHGAGKYLGKIALLTDLTRVLARDHLQGKMSAVVFAAARLGGIPVEPPEAMEPSVAKEIEEFLADEKASKVLGFYTWTQELERIFQQDRMLQSNVVDRSAVGEVARALHECRSAYATYVAYLTMVSRVTNPLAGKDLCDWLEHPALDDADPSSFWSFFPPSRAYETDLVKQLYGRTLIPDGFDLAREMVQRIRDGQLSLKPTAKSGWYDYQTWALEPLVLPEKMPEAAKLMFSEEYHEHLVELFKGIIALTRETHVKQLELPEASLALGPPRQEIYVCPQLSLEPLAEFYGRRAVAYGFIRDVLGDAFGADGLRKMRRLTPYGSVVLPLEDELGQMIALFRGAHACVNRQLALPPSDVLPELPDLGGAISTFQDWASELDKDPDLGRDTRMMVPVFYDVQREKLKVWVVLGWANRPLRISYVTPPTVQVSDENGRPADKDVEVKFSDQYALVAYPVSAEVYVSRLLNREEFQKHCDRHGTSEEILANLA